jgi:hypothetical protein
VIKIPEGDPPQTIMKRDRIACSVHQKRWPCSIRLGESLQLSATDLVGHLNCRYLTNLDVEVAHGNLAKPEVFDPLLEIYNRERPHESLGQVPPLTYLPRQTTVRDSSYTVST